MFEIKADHIKQGYSTNYKPKSMGTTTFCGETKEEAFIELGKAINAWRYCNDDNWRIQNTELSKEFYEWLHPEDGSPINYIKCGGDMY